jgi:hypothetical protein
VRLVNDGTEPFPSLSILSAVIGGRLTFAPLVLGHSFERFPPKCPPTIFDTPPERFIPNLLNIDDPTVLDETRQRPDSIGAATKPKQVDVITWFINMCELRVEISDVLAESGAESPANQFHRSEP